jgi:hypothetical protein
VWLSVLLQLPISAALYPCVLVGSQLQLKLYLYYLQLLCEHVNPKP